ncbi:hypothetical protein Btru_020320 [Bulinus truncatus]|nr:hypothetical protein Btru_020320 [Bulinus truncatus]
MRVKCTRVCSLCHEEFKSASDYKTHVQSAHMTAQQYTELDLNSNHLKFFCAFCPDSIVGYHQFCQHISNIDTPESECVSGIMLRHFQCAICHLDSRDIQLFRNHILHEHSTSRDVSEVQPLVDDSDFTTYIKNRFACNHCENTYSDMKGLKRHLAKVNGVTFWCEQSLIRSRQRQSFTYICNICSAGFNYPQNLARHRRCSHGIGHHGYFCHTCCISFSRKDVYKKHLQAQSHVFKQNESIRLEEMSTEDRCGLPGLAVPSN